MDQVQDIEEEVWKPIPGLDYFMASSFGRIRSIDRPVSRGKGQFILKGRVRKQQRHPRTGRMTLRLTRKIGREVHRLIAAAFLGVCPPKIQVNHKDGNPTNNRSDNLEYMTGSQNKYHYHRVLKRGLGMDSYAAKLTDNRVRLIRELHAEGVTFEDIGRCFGMSSQAVGRACNGGTWSHIQ